MSSDDTSVALAAAGLSDFIVPDKRPAFDAHVCRHVWSEQQLSAQATALAITFDDSQLAPVTAFSATAPPHPGAQTAAPGINIHLPYSILSYPASTPRLLHAAPTSLSTATTNELAMHICRPRSTWGACARPT